MASSNHALAGMGAQILFAGSIAILYASLMHLFPNNACLTSEEKRVLGSFEKLGTAGLVRTNPEASLSLHVGFSLRIRSNSQHLDCAALFSNGFSESRANGLGRRAGETFAVRMVTPTAHWCSPKREILIFFTKFNTGRSRALISRLPSPTNVLLYSRGLYRRLSRFSIHANQLDSIWVCRFNSNAFDATCSCGRA